MKTKPAKGTAAHITARCAVAHRATRGRKFLPNMLFFLFMHFVLPVMDV